MRLVINLLIITFCLISCNKEYLDNPVQHLSDWNIFQDIIADGVTMVYFNYDEYERCDSYVETIVETSKNEELSFTTFVIVEYDRSREIFDSVGVYECPMTHIYKNNEFREDITGTLFTAEDMASRLIKYK